VVARGGNDRLDQSKLVGNCAVQAEHELELHHSRVKEGDSVEAIMRRVEVSRRREDGRAVELTVAFNVACHAVDEVSHGDAGIGVVSVSVDNRSVINGAAGGERPHALVPMDMTREVCINTIFKHKALEGFTDV